MQTFHLICNAHIDPVWLWEWQEGAAAALATFRIAAEFCETFDGFMFNHNEVLLYEWIEEYEPELFARIQRLVAQGKWHIMGGWYLQPDCNMPSGEAFVRQILLGRQYFQEKFNVRPTTAINFDPFGHSRGLVQIMRKAGFESYIFCRPNQSDCPLPAEDFKWVGFDGSVIIGHRSLEFYNSQLGKAAEKVEKWVAEHPEQEVGLILWGVGNHGGGPSRYDLHQLGELMNETTKEGQVKIVHSVPEAYFAQLAESNHDLPEYKGSLNAWAVGCYTSQALIKQRHRQLENELWLTEKMLSHASLQRGLAYPNAQLNEVMRDLALAEFHDVLPGSAIQPVEEASLRLMDHGLEILSRLKTRAFFALAEGQTSAAPNTIPIMVYNPHPYKVEGVFECEFQLADINWNKEFTYPHVFQGETEVDSQPEKELSNIPLDWRKRVVFRAELEPSQLNRFDCHLEVLPEKPKPELQPQEGKITFETPELRIVINCETGLVDEYRVNGTSCLQPNAFLPLVLADNDDPWGMLVNSYREIAGEFKLASPEVSTRFSGVHSQMLPAVRIIEDGAVRSVVEVVLQYNNSSFICQRYKLPKRGTEVEIELTVYWNEKSQMLKLSVPTLLKQARCVGQVAYGAEELRNDGREVIAQHWVNVVSEDNFAFSCVNSGTYGLDFSEGELRLSLLRSPGYSGHPIDDRTIMSQDRFSPRIDQGERHFRFWFNAGESAARQEQIGREATAHNESPFVLSFFPGKPANVKVSQPVMVLDDATVQLTAFKQTVDGNGYAVRLFEPTGQSRQTRLHFPQLGVDQNIELQPFEIKTLRLNPQTAALSEVTLLE